MVKTVRALQTFIIKLFNQRMERPQQESLNIDIDKPRLHQSNKATLDIIQDEKQKLQNKKKKKTATDQENLEQLDQYDEEDGLKPMERIKTNKESNKKTRKHQQGNMFNQENSIIQKNNGTNNEKVKLLLKMLAIPILFYISICLYRDIRHLLSGNKNIFKTAKYETDEIFYVVMAGAVFKLWDDLKDGGFMKQGVFCSSLLMVLCFLCAYSCYQDFLFSTGVFLTELSVFIFSPKSYQGIAQKSCLYALPFLVLLSLPHAKMPTIFDIGAFLLHYLPILFTQQKYEEEYSMQKLKNRICSLTIAIAFITLFINYPIISLGVLKMMLMSVGYYGVSVAFQTYYQIRERKYFTSLKDNNMKKEK